MSDIFEEVDESIRQDRLVTLWKRWGIVVIGAAVLAVVGVGVYEYMSWSRSEAIKAQGDIFAKAAEKLDENSPDDAKASLAELTDGKGGYAVVSNLVLGGIEADTDGDLEAAGKHFQAAADLDKGVLSDIALLKLAYLRADEASIQELETLVAPLASKGGGTAALARELVAAKAFATGDLQRARTEYQALTLDLEAPQSMTARVTEALRMVEARISEQGGVAAETSSDSGDAAQTGSAPVDDTAQPAETPAQ
ncbi:MAG: tetratricopeptide repeat protein [Hyphomonadaceae bacterium]